MAKGNRITLYDLQLANGITTSPFVWGIRYALAHKGFDVDLVPGGFTGILDRTGGRTERLPAIVDDGKWVLDSWLIAEYLDETYPDRPALIPHACMTPLAKGLDNWFFSTGARVWIKALAVQYRARAHEADHEYITQTRERMWGGKLEDLIIGREKRLAEVLPQLQPLRNVLAESAWLGGDSPNYADYRILSVFLTMSSLADIPILTDDDPLRDWVERGLDLFDGLGRDPRLSPLFGFKPQPGDPEPFLKGGAIGGPAKRNTGPQSTAEETAHITGKPAPAPR
jgi:glutathione S-transferase